MANDGKNHGKLDGLVSRVLVGLCVVGTVLLISWLLNFSAYGMDFTDEGFYLLWMSDPYNFSWPATQFGYVYHSLYNLMSGDISAIRQVNVLITFGLAWILCYIFLGKFVKNFNESRIVRLAVSSGLATSVFFLFDPFLITPNYNSLNLQALLITAAGLVLVGEDAPRFHFFGWALIGLGGGLAFMAKPSTALALAIVFLVYIIFARKFSFRMFFIAFICALTLLLISAILFDGSVIGFIKRLRQGIDFSIIQDGGYSPNEMLRLDSFSLGRRFKIAFVMASGALLAAIASFWRHRSVIFFMVSISFFAITALLTLGQLNWLPDAGPFQGLLIFSVVAAMVVAPLFCGKSRNFKALLSNEWALAFFFIALPHVFAFGTNGNYWRQGSSAAIFWLLGGLTIIGPLVRERASSVLLLPAGFAVQAISAILLQAGIEEPYRQPQSLRLNSTIVEFGPQRSSLVLSNGYAEYILNAVSVAERAGFPAKTPVVDLSGQSPGILFALNAESVGQAWLIGGYPGSLNFVKAALDISSCEKISAAWILLETGGPRSLPADVMLSVGVDFLSSYRLVGSWSVPVGAGGYVDRHKQELYKPVDSQTILNNCQLLRTKNRG